MFAEQGISVRAACQEVRLLRTRWYRPRKARDDSAVIDALHTLVERKPRWGFWLCYKALRRAGHKWNHKRVWRVYRSLGLNIRRRAKKRVPARIKQPLTVPDRPNQCWSADFMSDTLYSGRRFRTFNLMDDFNREMLAIEVDTSLPSERVIRVLEQVVAWRGSPERLRVDNGPECSSPRCLMNGHRLMVSNSSSSNQANRHKTPTSNGSTAPIVMNCSMPTSSRHSTKYEI